MWKYSIFIRRASQSIYGKISTTQKIEKTSKNIIRGNNEKLMRCRNDKSYIKSTGYRNISNYYNVIVEIVL